MRGSEEQCFLTFAGVADAALVGRQVRAAAWGERILVDGDHRGTGRNCRKLSFQQFEPSSSQAARSELCVEQRGSETEAIHFTLPRCAKVPFTHLGAPVGDILQAEEG